MFFCGILAGGKGTRIKNSKVPKQFIEVCGTPVIIHTIREVLKIDEFEKIIIAMNSEWIDYAENLLVKWLKKEQLKRIKIIEGGCERAESFKNIVDFIYAEYDVADNDCIICHEAVRPFVTQDMIQECIQKTLLFKAAAVYVPAVDTVFTVENGVIVNQLNRSNLVLGQTPSGFNLSILKDLLEDLDKKNYGQLTSTTGLFLNNGYNVAVVSGDYDNIKITNNIDLVIAEKIFEKRRENDG